MKDATQRDYSDRLTQVLVHIQRHLDEELSLEDLADVALFSPFHFHRIFRGMVGESVKEHVRRIRLERAAHELRSSSRTVVDIALGAGYETHESFSRAFKRWANTSPSEFRNLQEFAIPTAPSNICFSTEAALDSRDILWPSQGQPPMKVKIEHRDPLRVAFVRHIGPYEECGEAWDRLLPELGAKGWIGAGTAILGLSHDDPDVTPKDQIRYDACVTVDDSFDPEGEIGVKIVEGGDYAVLTHSGPYEDLKHTYEDFFSSWLPQSGREPRGAPCVEFYLNDPQSTDPEDLLTDVHFPLKNLEAS